MSTRKTYFGMAGHYAAMSNFLHRGWNVAVPVIDVGDDALVLDDALGAVRRVQVKTGGEGEAGERRSENGRLIAKVTQYTLSRRQLREPKDIELYYMLMTLWDQRWRFILIRRDELTELRNQFLLGERDGPGRPRVADDRAQSDSLALTITWEAQDAVGWGMSFAAQLDTWHRDFVELKAGPNPRAPGSRLSPDPKIQSDRAPADDPPRDP